MQDEVWLVVSRQRVEKLTKGVPQLARGQICIKVKVKVDYAAFNPPTLEQEIVIGDWREGLSLDLPDTGIEQMTITQAEADMIKAQREQALVQMLLDRGYKVEPPTPGAEGENDES